MTNLKISVKLELMEFDDKQIRTFIKIGSGRLSLIKQNPCKKQLKTNT